MANGRPDFVSMQAAVSCVKHGSQIGFGGGNALIRRPVSFAKELIRQGMRDLHVFNMLCGIESDLLLGAGTLASTNCCYFGLDEFGQSAHFQRAAREKSITINEYSEFTYMAGLRAANQGLPFMPWKTAWGTHIVENLGFKSITCPYTGIELLAVPAINLDVSVIQATRCDLMGNVEVAVPLDFIWDYDYTVARAAEMVIVCAEEIVDEIDPMRTGMIGREVDLVVHSPRGAWPGGIHPLYQVDINHFRSAYVPATRTEESFRSYLDHYINSENP